MRLLEEPWFERGPPMVTLRPTRRRTFAEIITFSSAPKERVTTPGFVKWQPVQVELSDDDLKYGVWEGTRCLEKRTLAIGNWSLHGARLVDAVKGKGTLMYDYATPLLAPQEGWNASEIEQDRQLQLFFGDQDNFD